METNASTAGTIPIVDGAPAMAPLAFGAPVTAPLTIVISVPTTASTSTVLVLPVVLLFACI